MPQRHAGAIVETRYDRQGCIAASTGRAGDGSQDPKKRMVVAAGRSRHHLVSQGGRDADREAADRSDQLGLHGVRARRSARPAETGADQWVLGPVPASELVLPVLAPRLCHRLRSRDRQDHRRSRRTAGLGAALLELQREPCDQPQCAADAAGFLRANHRRQAERAVVETRRRHRRRFRPRRYGGLAGCPELEQFCQFRDRQPIAGVRRPRDRLQ